MAGPVEHPKTRRRRDDRNRRLRSWAACAGAGGIAGILLWLGVGGPGGAMLACAALLAGLALGHRFMIAAAGVPVLTYHSVSPDASWLPWADEISVHPDTLRQHLRAMRSMGCEIVPTRRLVDARCGRGRLPPRPVVLHFDDGYLDNWLHAAPILRQAGAPATFFASLDFIAPGDTPRGGAEPDESGYMNWAELAELERDPLFDVEPHGIDHGRVPISARVVDTLTEANWRSLAWVQWAQMPGPKYDWHRHETPPAVPLGSPVPESEGALAAPAFFDGRVENGEEYRGRLAGHLGRCAAEFSKRLGRPPEIFCWPENRVSAAGREIAERIGFTATTGGEGRNATTEPPLILSRIHAGDRALGFRFKRAERLYIRAAIGLFEGNHYWYLVAGPMSAVRKVVTALRRRRAALNQLSGSEALVSLRHSRDSSPPSSVTG